MMAPKQWADGPWKLIESPGKTRDPNSHGAIYFANQMAFLHNAFIRGMNSIYLQAPYVRDPADIKDFLFYVKAWCDFLHHHHQIEEDIAFPELEALIGQPGCMSGNVDQHHAFEPRMARLEAYALETKAENYSGARVRELVQDLADELYQHLVDEIPSLLALEKYDGAGMVKIFKKAEKEAMTYPGELAMPMVLGWSDNTFEGGKHIFPEIPGFARYLVRYWYSRPHRGAWRFLPCDNWGMPQPLKFVE